MSRLSCKFALLTGAVVVLLVTSASALAQRGGGGFRRLFRPIATLSLAQLDEVQAELKLTDDQKTKITELNGALREARRETFQDAAGDFERVWENLAKVNAEFAQRLNATFDEPQRKRALEIFVQVNEVTSITDEGVAKALEFTDEQSKSVQQAVEDSRAEWFASFQDFQNMTDEQRAEKIDELVEARDTSLIAVLTDEQQEKLEKLKGEKLEVNLENLPGPGQ